MEWIREVLQWIQPEHIIQVGGLLLVTAVIFAETGLMVGFFLPGDSLLFTVGLFVALGILSQSVVLVGITLTLAAILGDQVGYWTGRWMGHKLFEKPDSRLFKRKYLDQTRAFYNRHGGKTIILGRFVPIVRTFAPILAGAVKMPPRIFTSYNVIGGVVWIWGLLLLGYGLGKQFPILRSYIELVALGIIFLSVLPIVKTYLQERRVSASK
ncbi:MAG: VTT domain-containing protein [Bacteroidia bacterium]